MRLKNYLINEASFSNSKLDRVVQLLLKTIGSKAGGTLYPFGGEGKNTERFKKSNGNKGLGMTYVMDNGKLIRFNWESSKKSSTITSIDIFKDMKTDKSISTLDIPPNYNIVQSVKSIISFIKNPKKANLSEAAYGKQRIADAEKYDIPIDLPTKEFNARMKAKWAELGEPTSTRARKSAGLRLDSPSTEINSRNAEIKKGQKVFDNQKYADPDVVFDDLDDLIGMVSKGIQPSLLITGMAGIGKCVCGNTLIDIEFIE